MWSGNGLVWVGVVFINALALMNLKCLEFFRQNIAFLTWICHCFCGVIQERNILHLTQTLAFSMILDWAPFQQYNSFGVTII